MARHYNMNEELLNDIIGKIEGEIENAHDDDIDCTLEEATYELLEAYYQQGIYTFTIEDENIIAYLDEVMTIYHGKE